MLYSAFPMTTNGEQYLDVIGQWVICRSSISSDLPKISIDDKRDNLFFYYTDNHTTFNIEIKNTDGQTVLQSILMPTETGNHILSIENLPAGDYVLYMYNENMRFTGRFNIYN